MYMNSQLGNVSWQQKRFAYRLLGARTPDEANAVITEAASQAVTIPAGIEANATYHHLSACVGERSASWTLEFLDQRSKRLAGLAWDRLAPWLQA